MGKRDVVVDFCFLPSFFAFVVVVVVVDITRDGYDVFTPPLAKMT